MSYSAQQFNVFNSQANPLGIPAHDFMKNTITNGNIVRTEFFTGGNEDQGTLVAQLDFTYDAFDNIVTLKRTV